MSSVRYSPRAARMSGGRPADLRDLLRYEAVGRDQLSERLFVPGLRPRASAGDGRPATAARLRDGDAGTPRLQQTAVAAFPLYSVLSQSVQAPGTAAADRRGRHRGGHRAGRDVRNRVEGRDLRAPADVAGRPAPGGRAEAAARR